MDSAYLIQFAVSAVAICVMAAVAAWARIPKATPPLGEASARALIAGELPDVTVDQVWVDKTGDTAVARAGEEGVVLFRVGDGYAVREMPWAALARSRADGGRVLIHFDDPGAPLATFGLHDLDCPFLEAAR